MRNAASVDIPTIVPPSSRAMNRSVAGDPTTSPSSAVDGGGLDDDSCETSRSTASTMAGVSVVAISTFTPRRYPPGRPGRHAGSGTGCGGGGPT